MTINTIVTDPSLQSVLDISTQSRLQCLSLFDFTDANPLSPSASHPAHLETTLYKQQKILYARLAQLRGANRNALLAVRNAKQVTAEARQEVDRLHLQLQNLYYEQRHLRGEISSCESYEYVEKQRDIAMTLRQIAATNTSSSLSFPSKTSFDAFQNTVMIMMMN